MRSISSLALAIAASVPLQATSIPLSGVSATFDQGGDFHIGATLDGTVVDGLSGWGVFNGQFQDQAAVWTAATPVTSASGIIFTMPQFYPDGGHHIQKFRLSLTQDAIPSLGGTWTSIAPAFLFSSGGVTLSDAGSDTILATGVGKTTFRLGLAGAVANATGFRLELFTHDFDPLDSVPASIGRAFNGNLVLSQFMVDTPEAYNWAIGASPSASGTTWPGMTPDLLVDGNLTTLTHPESAGQAGFFYTLDLGGMVDLSSIEIYNRDNCCPERLSRFRVEVLDALGTSVWSADLHTDGSNSGAGGVDMVTEGMGAGIFEGQFIRITNINSADYSPQIAEVKAFGAAVPEPGSAALLMAAGLSLMGRSGRRRGR